MSITLSRCQRITRAHNILLQLLELPHCPHPPRHPDGPRVEQGKHLPGGGPVQLACRKVGCRITEGYHSLDLCHWYEHSNLTKSMFNPFQTVNPIIKAKRRTVGRN